MKRLIALFMILLVCVSLLTACSGTCAMCGKEGRVHGVEVRGVEKDYCENCKKIAEAAQGLLG